VKSLSSAGQGIAFFIILAVGARGESLTVATYNLENYVAAGRRIEERYLSAYPKPEAAKAAVRAVIGALQADLLALQEMGPGPYLEELRRDLEAEGILYPYAAVADAADADRHTAVLSRRPLRRIVTHRDLEFPYFDGRESVKRGLLEVAVDTGRGELTLFVVHLKSRLAERAGDPGSARRRAAEARAIRDRILQRFPDPARARFLIIGDCNDTADRPPVRLLAARGGTVVASVLAAADPRGDTWTFIHRREGSYLRLDYVLVSPGLRPAVAGDVGHIYDGAGVRAASDHRPVWVRLDLDLLPPGIGARP
jgi:endonuclease/exonuclease/phosphatase family metal-dependent hydrolase